MDIGRLDYLPFLRNNKRGIVIGGVSMSGKIIQVLPDSIAEEIGIQPGDALLSINGEPVADLIDYNFYCADDELELELKRADGEIWMCEVEKDPDEDLGLVFAANVFDRDPALPESLLVLFYRPASTESTAFLAGEG